MLCVADPYLMYLCLQDRINVYNFLFVCLKNILFPISHDPETAILMQLYSYCDRCLLCYINNHIMEHEQASIFYSPITFVKCFLSTAL